MARLKLTKGQRNQVFDCRVGYGVAAYKSAENEICYFEFFVDRHNRMCYITTGKPVEFDVRYDVLGNEETAALAQSDSADSSREG